MKTNQRRYPSTGCSGLYLLFISVFVLIHTSVNAQQLNGRQVDNELQQIKNSHIGSFFRPFQDTFRLLKGDTGFIALKHDVYYVWKKVNGVLKWIPLTDYRYKGLPLLSNGIKTSYFNSLVTIDEPVTVVRGISPIEVSKDNGSGSNPDTVNIDIELDPNSHKVVSDALTTRVPVYTTIASMRAMAASALDVGTVYKAVINGISGEFLWDASSTATDDGVMIIQRTGTSTGRFVRYFENYIHVDWFGAVPNDAGDDSEEIQDAIDFALASSKAPEVRLSGGNYHAHNIKIAIRNGNEYDQGTLRVKGAGFVISPGTQITVDSANAVAFFIQTARQVEIENIGFIGQLSIPAGYEGLITATQEQLTSGCRNNRYSPHAAIADGAFFYTVPENDRYPHESAWYTNTGTGGSSQITIRNCSFKKFVTAFVQSPGGGITNGDNIKIQDSYFESNKVAWAACQTQSRSNSMENCYFLFHEYIVNGNEYGGQTGTAPNLINCNFAGATKYLYVINNGFGGMTIDRCRAESLFSIGKSATVAINITDSEFTFSIPGSDGAFASPRLAEGDQVDFKGGYLGWFDNLGVGGLPFYVKNLSFNGISLSGLPVNFHPSVYYVYLNKTVFDNVKFLNTNGVGDVWQSNSYVGIEYGTLHNNVVMPGSEYIEENPYGNRNRYNVYRSGSPKIEQIYIESKTLNIDSSNNTAYFIASNAGAYLVNDLLTGDYNVNWDNDIYNTAPTSIGWIYAISGDTIKLKYVPYGLTESIAYDILITRVPHFIGKTFGTTANGSNTISSVQYHNITFSVGSMIKGAGIPAGTRVTAIGGGTITLSRNATATASNVEFHDAIMRGEGYADDPSDAHGNVGFSKGDIVWNMERTYGPNNGIAFWICTSGGWVNGPSPAATWTPVYAGSDASKADLASPAFTGTPTVPTATAGTNTTQIASTAFVQTALANFVSGKYTPSLTSVNNIAASTAYECQYLRLGNVVTVSGKIEIDASAASTSTELAMSMPVASNFSNEREAGGTANCPEVASLSAGIKADAANDRILIKFVSLNTDNNVFYFSFTYYIN